MPLMIYGTAWKKERTAELVRSAIGAGFRGIDTACQPKHYDEAAVGSGVAACRASGLRRSDLYLQTKFTPLDGHDPARIPYDSHAPLAMQVAQSFEASLRNLQTDYVDALILHSPLASGDETLEAWRAMEAIANAGGARSLGISNCYSPEALAALYSATRVKPAVVQNRFCAETGFDQQIRLFCRQHWIVYQSFWTLTANGALLDNEAVRTSAARHGRTPAQVLFRYLSQRDVVPLTGTTSVRHMREDLSIGEFELTTEECAGIDALVAAG